MNIFNKTYLLFFSIFLSFTIDASAQIEPNLSCGTITTQENLEFYKSIQSKVKKHEQKFLSLSNTYSKTGIKTINSIPIKAHILRYSNGSSGLSVSDLNSAIDNLNTIYADAYLEFFLCDGINYIDDDDLVHIKKNKDNTVTEANNVSGLINIYFTHSIRNDAEESICGYTDNAFRNDVIIMKNNCVKNTSSLAHEMGHFFSLIHTHGSKNNTQTTELVDGSNCDTDGDGICDTPADPKLSSSNVDNFCNYIGTATDANGDLFEPDTGNMMSYSLKGCRTHFSTQQLARIYGFYHSTKKYLSCPSFNAEFSTDINQTCEERLTVNFENNCSNTTKWEWDMNSDGITDYTTQNPTHTFDSGNYDVTLKVSNKSKTISKTYSKYIKVGTQPEILNENFERFEMAGDNGWTANDVSKNGYNWYSNFGETSSDGTGPNNDNTSGEFLGKYIYAEASAAKPGDIAEFISPCINVEYSNSELEFAYHMFGQHVGELHMDIKTDSGYINDVIPALYGSQQKNQEDPFLIKNVDLSPYTNQTINIRFRAIRGASWDGDIAIDDIFIKTIRNTVTDEHFRVYPNPIKNNLLFVKTNNVLQEEDFEATVSYQISNLVGQQFLSGTITNQPINVSNLSSGTYLLTLTDSYSKVIKKIIK